MGFALTVLYLFTAYLGPVTVFGPLAAVHIEVVIAAIALLVSLPALQGSLIWKTPQSLALIGLAFATLMSILMTGWAGGAVQVFLDFIPNAFAYFLVCLHCNSKKRLQILVFMLLFVCLFVIARGYDAVQHLPPAGKTNETIDTEDSYVIVQNSDNGDQFYRIRGQDFIHDPNDFAQLLTCVTPLMFIFWRPKKMLRNIAFVLLPVCILLFGVFLTHSRGGLLAILALTVVAARRRIGTVPSLLAAAGLFFAGTALNFTGGREISADSGSGRMDLWAGGLQTLKSHPFFGVGYNRLPDYIGMTAHNTVVVCAAELGLVGLYFWSLFMFPTLRDALAVASPARVKEAGPIIPGTARFSKPIEKIAVMDKAEINKLGRLAVLSFTGFLVTGWFLSRAYIMTLFLLGGIVESVFEMALRRGMIAPRMQMNRVLRYTGGFTLGLLILVYAVLRFGNIMR